MTVSVSVSNPAEWLKAELEAVEETLAESAASEVELLHSAARHILDAGGKRLRPQLTLLAARSVGYDGARAIALAAVMELVHTATLVHDDIMDESDSRRGRVTVNNFWGNSASVLMGDFLVIRAFSLLAALGEGAPTSDGRAPTADRRPPPAPVSGDAPRHLSRRSAVSGRRSSLGGPRLFRLMCDTIARMCEGEVLQICFRGDPDVSEDAYCTIIDYKTAVLMSSCCRAGALLGQAKPAEVEALARFGRELGMAFQIQDDVLDFIGDEQMLGKPVGGDLREGKVTLPLIYALRRAGEADRRTLDAAFARTAPLGASDIAGVVALIERYDGFEAARDRAREFLADAKAAVTTLPASCARDGLIYIADRIVDRRT
jgi:octaprenyl-diphosphate synthase